MNQDTQLLQAKGWVNDPSQGPWQWQLPSCPAAWYLLKDALSLQHALDRQPLTAKKFLTH